jgi:hypothetical protein
MPDRCHVQSYAPENSVQNRLFGLAAPEKEQLRQRTSSIGRLSPLTLRKIGENGKGVPRNINPLCFNAMLLGFADAPSQSLTPRIRRDAHA